MSEEQKSSPETEEVEIQAEATAEASAESELPTVDAVQAELAAAQEQVLRAQAEVQNARRRAEQDVEKAHRFGQEKLINDLLPVVDNLERAIESIDTADEAFKGVLEGIELTLKSFTDTLVRHKVEAINPVGEPFDPQLHQAMTMVPSPDAEPNTVLTVFQKGYSLHGRLVRPAMVVVAKAPDA